MDLKVMTVGTNPSGNPGEAAVKPYEFDARESDKDPWHKVTIVMPLGGVESGLFRYPKAGEKVLVSEASGVYYLMGYLPNTTDQPFSAAANQEGIGNDNRTKKEVIDQQGQVFRYKKTGTNTSADEYSEIGFYNKETDWKPAAGTLYPKIDHLNIQSTGDIRSTAGNHQLIMGKRLEILSGDTIEINHRTNKVKNSEDLPLGDKKGDDSNLHKGDLHIRAGGRVVIKAAKEIRLQVGRTTLTIDDKGFKVVTKKVNSNWPNTCDTTLSLNPRTGVSMSGQNVTMSGTYKVSMGDSLGGNISTQIGAVQISGRDVSLSNYDLTEYLINYLGALVETGFNSGLLGAALTGKEYNVTNASSVKLTLDSLIKVKNIIKKIVGQVIDYKKMQEFNKQAGGAGAGNQSDSNRGGGAAAGGEVGAAGTEAEAAGKAAVAVLDEGE